MQTILVIITFTLALGFLLKKFVWDAAFETKKNSSNTLDGGNTKPAYGTGRCGKGDCGCH